MRFRFDNVILDAGRRELLRDGAPVAVEPQVFDLLLYLVENRDSVVSKDDVLNAVWRGRIVSESTLTTRINAARKALGDSGEEQRLIRTLPRKGFRFVGEVQDDSTLTAREPVRTTPAPGPALTLPDKPSIAVLPFTNMSGDPEQEYFADGLVEDIITALSSFNSLFVIARNSSFTYKGRPVDLKQVGRELGVRYVLEGSVRKAANQLRITAQLVDSSTGVHLWGQRFDGSLEDIFDLQDRITMGVVGPIAPRLERAEIERAKRKPTESLDAYDYYLRGVADLQRVTKQSNETALQLFYKAIEIDANFASALAMAARCYMLRKTNRWMIDPAQETAEAVRLARRAIEVGKDDAVALCYAGYALVHAAHELESGAAIIERATALNPHLATAWQLSGTVQAFLGRPEIAIEHVTRAMRLSPLDPGLWAMQSAIALAYFIAGRYDDASSWAEKAIGEGTNFLPNLRMVVASKALEGRQDEARNALRRLLQVDPTSRISNAFERALFHRLQDATRLAEGLRMAGLPE